MTLSGFSTSLASEIDNNDYFGYVLKTSKKTVKQDDNLIIQIHCTALSASSSEPLNLGIIAPTSEGKTYPIVQSLSVYPQYQVWYVGRMSPKALIRMNSIPIDVRTNQPVADDIKRIKREIFLLGSSKGEKKKKAALIDELEELQENVKHVINLAGKILVFLEPADPDLWDIIKPILSHDADEIDYPYVDKDAMITKSVLIRGQPACIFCSAKDESDRPQWFEVASRFLITSPNMVRQKYLESNILIGQKAGLPRSLQQEIIVSDQELERARECIIHIQDQMKSISGVWIPYLQILANALPDEKGTDNRAAKRVFSLLRILPLVRSELRSMLRYPGSLNSDNSESQRFENLVVASTQDLKDALKVAHNSSSVPAYKMKFYYDIFCKCCEEEEDVNKRVTVRKLCDYVKEKTGKRMTADNLRKTYINELWRNGIIEEYEVENPETGKIKREKEYGRLIVSVQTTQHEFGKVGYSLQDFALHVANKYINIPENWLDFEIMALKIRELQNDKIGIFLKGLTEDEITQYGVKGDQNEGLGPEWVRIRLEKFREIYEKNCKLSSLVLMPENCENRINFYPVTDEKEETANDKAENNGVGRITPESPIINESFQKYGGGTN